MGWIGGARLIDCAASRGLEGADHFEVGTLGVLVLGLADFNSGGQRALGFESSQASAREVVATPLTGELAQSSEAAIGNRDGNALLFQAESA